MSGIPGIHRMRPLSLLAPALLAACTWAEAQPDTPAGSPSTPAGQASSRVGVDVPLSERGPPSPLPPESEPPSHTAPEDASVEDAMVAKINAYRAAHGLLPLAVRPVLVDKARTWAKAMSSGACGADRAGAPKICHSSLRDGITVPYGLLAENVGRVAPPDVDLLESAFEKSPSHSAEMLNRSFKYIGVGVSYRDDYMFVAEVFMAPLEE